MRKRNKTVQLSRPRSHRQALLRNLAQSLIRYGKIETTLAKAKALRSFVEPLITKAKKQGELAEKALAAVLYDREVVRKLINEIGPRYRQQNRPGGYTRIIKLGPRGGDNAETAIIQLVEGDPTGSEGNQNQDEEKH